MNNVNTRGFFVNQLRDLFLNFDLTRVVSCCSQTPLTTMLVSVSHYRPHLTESNAADPKRSSSPTSAIDTLSLSANFQKLWNRRLQIPMESTISSPISSTKSSPLLHSASHSLGSRSQSFPSLPLVQTLRYPSFKSRSFLGFPFRSRQNQPIRSQSSNHQPANDGFVLEDVPHLTNFLPNLPVIYLISN